MNFLVKKTAANKYSDVLPRICHNICNSLRARDGFIQPISKVYVIGIWFQIELTKIFVTNGWSDQEVNAQIDKDLNP